jgi:molybdopterin-guanine dinucleotide biosynthesis protein A
MKKHQKHADILKPKIGLFGRNEISIIGTPCGNIKKLAYEIINSLSDRYKIGYVDADHKGGDEEGISEKSALKYNASLEYVDKINFHRFDTTQVIDEYQMKQRFNGEDLVLVNGNHFKASSQIVVIDSKKPLEKKLDKLTNVVMILMQEGENEVPEYLRKHLTDYVSIPKYGMAELSMIINLVDRKMRWNVPPLKGLVLAGGKSTRMNQDKSLIDYHGKSQRIHMYDMLTQICNSGYIAIRSEQSNECDNVVNVIADKFIGLGPYGAILSAFQMDPNAAWLITACDQPLLDKKTLDLLISKRNSSKFATAFYNPETDFPEPLITIWEPRAYARLLYFLSLGYSCPRKVLINSDIELVKLDNPSVLKNANTPQEYEELKAQLE